MKMKIKQIGKPFPPFRLEGRGCNGRCRPRNITSITGNTNFKGVHYRRYSCIFLVKTDSKVLSTTH